MGKHAKFFDETPWGFMWNIPLNYRENVVFHGHYMEYFTKSL